MTLAFWQAGDLEAAARSVRDWARVDGERPAPTASPRASTKTSARWTSREEAARRARRARPLRRGRGERLGRLRLRLMDREGALEALERALSLGADGEVKDLVVKAPGDRARAPVPTAA